MHDDELLAMADNLDMEAQAFLWLAALAESDGEDDKAADVRAKADILSEAASLNRQIVEHGLINPPLGS